MPVNADCESGFACDPQGVAESVRLAIETDVAGLCIEDASPDDIPNALHNWEALPSEEPWWRHTVTCHHYRPGHAKRHRLAQDPACCLGR